MRQDINNGVLTSEQGDYQLWQHVIRSADLGLKSVMLLIMSDPKFHKIEEQYSQDMLEKVFSSQSTTPDILLRLLTNPEIAKEINYEDIFSLSRILQKSPWKRQDPKYAEVTRRLLEIGAFRGKNQDYQTGGYENPLTELGNFDQEDLFEQIIWGDSARTELLKALRAINSSTDEEDWEYAVQPLRSWLNQMVSEHGSDDPAIRYILDQ
jgi:hypothetical protein